MEKVKNLVVGNGFTALLLASKLPDAVLLAPQQEIGGLIAARHRNGFVFDFGGHVYTTQDANVTALMKEANATYHPERHAFYDFEKMVPFPVQDHAEMIGLEVVKGNKQRDNENTAYGYFAEEFGTQFAKKFMTPFNKRVWSTHPKLMDKDWTEGRVKRRDENSKNWGMNSSFYYATGEKIVEVMQQRAHKAGAEYIFGTVIAVDIQNKIATCRSDDGKEIFKVEYERLFDTAGLDLGFANYRSNRVLSLGIGLDDVLDENFHWVYSHVDSIVHRTTLISRYAEGMAPAGCDSLLLEIPYIEESEHVEAKRLKMAASTGDEKKLKELALAMLKNAGFSSPWLNVATVWLGDSRGYPVQTVGIRRNVAEKKAVLANFNYYLAGRWGSHLYANLQHLFLDAEAAARFATMDGEFEDDYLHSAFYYA